jgi:GAF domain-containing protein
LSNVPTVGLEAGREALRRFLAGEDDLATMHARIVLIATESISACDQASITMLRGDRPHTPAYTDKTALVLDKVQYESGDGPCLTAIRHRGAEQISTENASRWPAFSEKAREHGVLSTLSVPLGNDEAVLGALNLYSESAEEYDSEAVESACVFADQLGVAAASVTVYVEGYELSNQLQQAMESRAVIEQAKGILIAMEHCDPDTAFHILVRASQRENRKLRAIAQDIVDKYTGGQVAAGRR